MPRRSAPSTDVTSAARGPGKAPARAPGRAARQAGPKPVGAQGAARTFVAVDWSGAITGERRKLWLAEARQGRLLRLEAGRRRAELIDHLCDLARREPRLVVGIDMAFSLPGWFLRERGVPSAPALWDLVAERGEEWLRTSPAPFWGRKGSRRPAPDPSRPLFRRTESETPPQAGIGPKSPFQIQGAGAVGTGSLRGMPFLATLREAGLAVWPFDPPRTPLVLEIYPRDLTGPVAKSNAAARWLHLARYERALGPLLERAASSEDAFDAAVSAIAMERHADALAGLSRSTDETTLLEGAIWRPPPLRTAPLVG